MNVIYNPNYMKASDAVNSIYESEETTLNKLDYLYAGHDLIVQSINTALMLGGNAQETLEAQLDDELEQLLLESLADERNIITVSPRISNKDLEQHLLEMRHRYAENAKHADDFETAIYSDIHSYELQAMQIKVETVIDFIDLKFEVSTPTTRSLIKKYLTEKTGTRYYIADDESDIVQDGHVFTIRVHDIKTKKDLYKIIKCLAHYGVSFENVKVQRIEVAIDFYGAKSKALLIALFKSLSYAEHSRNERIYKKDIGKFISIPDQPVRLLAKLEDGYCIGVNPKDSLIYYRLYNKTTDKQQSLPEHERRLRAEVNCAVSALGTDDSLSNLEEIIRCTFGQMKFTKLNRNASMEDKKLYRNSIAMFGLRREQYYSKNRHKRELEESVTKNGELNKIISKKVSNLKRNF